MTASCQARWAGLTCTQRQIKDNTLDDNLPNPGAPPRNALRQEPVASVGPFAHLPLELLDEILFQLDLISLFRFRLVNRCAAVLVDTFPEYTDIFQHASNAIRGILAIGIGPLVTCKTLHKSLCTAHCQRCGDFGGYIYLFTCKRVCFLCFSNADEFLPLAPSRARRRFGLEHRGVKTLPKMTVVPGTYSPRVVNIGWPPPLIDYECARLAGIKFHGSSDAMEKHVSRAWSQIDSEYRGWRIERILSDGSERRPWPPTWGPMDYLSGNPFRFVAIARVPWLDKVAQRAESGFYCVGCERSRIRPSHWRMLFSPDTFEEHLAKCGEIKYGKHCPS